MLFQSVEYAVFLAFVLVAYWGLARNQLSRAWLLVLASAWFYTRFDYGKAAAGKHLGWVYLGVLFASATVDFILAGAIGDVDASPLAGTDPKRAVRRRSQLLVVSIAYNLGVLAYFKYTGFAAETVRSIAAAAGLHIAPFVTKVILPIGISFFTFETLSYTVDVYRRELVPLRGWRGFLDYLVFISFFPHLAAGPIIRPKDLLPQLRRAPIFEETRASEAIFLIATGLVKKVVLADYLGLNLVDRVFDRPEWFSAPECIAAIYGYALQIYGDFSGYTDCAIGSALLLGIALPPNFRAPYQSRDLQEFWRRWHISLSTWLRDYLYIPLGGSKGSELATYRNLMITMLLGGLWHGASWNFVVWGALHGGALAVVRWFQRRRDRLGKTRVEATWAKALGIVVTFHYVCFAWVFFRADGFGRARAMLRQIVVGGWHVANIPATVALVIVAGFVAHALPDDLLDRGKRLFSSLPAPLQGAALFGVAWTIKTVGSAQVVPFRYFQF